LNLQMDLISTTTLMDTDCHGRIHRIANEPGTAHIHRILHRAYGQLSVGLIELRIRVHWFEES
jgi:hypothetical protein